MGIILTAVALILVLILGIAAYVLIVKYVKPEHQTLALVGLVVIAVVFAALVLFGYVRGGGLP